MLRFDEIFARDLFANNFNDGLAENSIEQHEIGDLEKLLMD